MIMMATITPPIIRAVLIFVLIDSLLSLS